MATPVKLERLVSRMYRAAIRIGEDFITLEETITLPVEASDEDVAQAIDLGLRIEHAQREAIEAQIAALRETAGAPARITVRDPDAPASDKQRTFISTLQDTLNWSDEQMMGHAKAQNIDLLTMTKGQASAFIDGLKNLSEERSAATRLFTTAQTPTTTAEAEQRFFARYSDKIGGSDWQAVQRFLRRPRVPVPTNIDEWLQAARIVREHRAE